MDNTNTITAVFARAGKAMKSVQRAVGRVMSNVDVRSVFFFFTNLFVRVFIHKLQNYYGALGHREQPPR